MPIIPIYGHGSLKARLHEAVGRGALPGSLLFAGPRGVGKQRLALWLAQTLQCTAEEGRPCDRCQSCRYALEGTHPDIHWYFPRPRLKLADASLADVREDYGDAIAERVKEGGLYPPSTGSEGIFVATVRAIVQAAVMSPAIGRMKMFVVGDAERMVPQEGADAAANAFLKLLEEPPTDTVLILTSSEPGALLPTIRSRVVTVRVPPLPDAAVAAFLADTRMVAYISGRRALGGVRAADLVQTAGGAPGRLLAIEERNTALVQARRLLETATGPDRADEFRAAFLQGGSKARGSFTDTLDALTSLLHERARGAVGGGDERRAVGAARAIDMVERAKEMAAGNVNPQLLSASITRQLATLLP